MASGLSADRQRPLRYQASYVFPAVPSTSWRRRVFTRVRLMTTPTRSTGSRRPFTYRRMLPHILRHCQSRARIGRLSEQRSGAMLWRPEGTTLSKPRAEARRALRALAQPWVAYVVHTESQRDGPNPTRIVRPIPVHNAGRVHGTHLETTFVDDVVADSGCTSSRPPPGTR